LSLIIDVQQVSKHYGDKTALQNLTFSLEQGAPVALVGPNGAGKTTLFSLLCGYIQPSSGDISILGHRPGSPALFGRLSALPQDAQFDPRFAIEKQINFYARLQGMSHKVAKYDTHRVLDMVGLADVANSPPNALSHGMRKRAAIAQAFLGSPEIVMLDEATAGLDPIHAREIRTIVADHANSVNFILSSHDLTELERLCDQVLYLDKGQLKQHQAQDNEACVRYITLRMKQHHPELISAMLQISGVNQVSMTQDREYLLAISNEQAKGAIEAELLMLLAKKHWPYAQITNGKTLENRLF
jgi:ABC-2 type transport system ATP-binding protein